MSCTPRRCEVSLYTRYLLAVYQHENQHEHDWQRVDARNRDIVSLYPHDQDILMTNTVLLVAGDVFVRGDMLMLRQTTPILYIRELVVLWHTSVLPLCCDMC